MGYDIIPLIIMITSLTIIIFIVIRKFGELAAIDLATLVTERDAKVKKDIMDQRFVRFTTKLKQFIKKIFAPFFNLIEKNFKNLKSKAKESYKEIEKKQILNVKSNPSKENVVKKHDIIQDKLSKAKEAYSKNEYLKAEELYIDVINLDGNNLGAYEGLVDIYYALKDYEKEKQTLFFILKLIKKRGKYRVDKSTVAKFYHKLAELSLLEGDQILAIENLKQVIELEPNNPKYIDQLLDLAIIEKEIDLSQSLLLRLRNVNPENKKLTEYSQRIRELMLRR